MIQYERSPRRILPSRVIGRKDVTYVKFPNGRVYDLDHVLSTEGAIEVWTEQDVPIYEERQDTFRVVADDWSKSITAVVEFSPDGRSWVSRVSAPLEEDGTLHGTSYIGLWGFYPKGGWLRLRVGG